MTVWGVGYRFCATEQRNDRFMRALHVRLTLAFALLLAGLAVGLLVLLSRTSDRYSDEVLQRLNSGIAPYVVQELPLLKGGKVNEAALHELAHRTMTVNPSAEVYLLDPSGRAAQHGDTPQPHSTGFGEARADPDLSPVPGHAGHCMEMIRQAWLRGASFRSRPSKAGDRSKDISTWCSVGSQRNRSTRVYGEVTTLRTAAAALALVLAATLLIAGVLFTALTRRLRQLDHRMHAWAMALPATALGPTDHIDFGDEISALADRFRTMSEAIEHQIRDLKATDELRRELIANVSHDLRTPLASLRGYIETALVKDIRLLKATCAHT